MKVIKNCLYNLSYQILTIILPIITVSGVFSSCEASDINRRCEIIASLTGRILFFTKYLEKSIMMDESIKKRAVSKTESLCKLFISLLKSVTAIRYRGLFLKPELAKSLLMSALLKRLSVSFECFASSSKLSGGVSFLQR